MRWPPAWDSTATTTLCSSSSRSPCSTFWSPAQQVCGWAGSRGASLLGVAGGVVLAEIVLMAFGFGWLALGAQMASGATGIGFAKAWAAGVQPFLLGDLIKAALAASLVGAGWSVLKRRG